MEERLRRLELELEEIEAVGELTGLVSEEEEGEAEETVAAEAEGASKLAHVPLLAGEYLWERMREAREFGVGVPGSGR